MTKRNGKEITCLLLQQFLRDEYLFTLDFNKALNSSKRDRLCHLPCTERKWIRHFIIK
jgi:hypothetical protein